MMTSTKRSAMSGLGVVVLIVGLLAAIGLWYSAGQREIDAVRNLARAPSGCDTTLDFEAAGDFTIYIETAGRFDTPIAGDCASEGDYALPSGDLPSVSLALTSPDGQDIELASDSGISYDADGFHGQSVRTFRVDTPGDHVLRVEVPGESDVRLAVAVGRDPSDGVGTMQLGAVLAALAALVVGGGLILLARRSTAPAPVTASSGEWPAGPAAWPMAPPGMPAAPAPESWQPVVGPPTQPPGALAAPPIGQPPTGSPPPYVPPQSPGSPPSADSAVPPSWAPTPTSPSLGSSGDGSAGDGSSGDGQRSPWAPPSDTPR